MAQLTETEVRAKYREFLATTPGAAEVLSDNDYDFYHWCSDYGHYKHITHPMMKGAA